jgi:uncharacterized protein with HEPN domain
MRRERLYLEDIVTAADAIADFTCAQNLESFEEVWRSATARVPILRAQVADILRTEVSG